MITITFALPAESSGFIRHLTSRSVSHRGGTTIITGRLSGRDLEIVHTGVGKRIAAERLVQYLATASPALLISSGFAGGSREEDEVGELVLAQNFSDAHLLASVRQTLGEQNVEVANLFTASEMVDAVAQREQVWQRYEAVAIDMETEAIAQVCVERQLRLLSIRALSDTPRCPFPLPSGILFDLERQRTPGGRLLAHLLAHPGAIPRLLKFSRQIARARRNLTDALVKVAKAIS
jgi:adenosylhomocysteine nucleosidase